MQHCSGRGLQTAAVAGFAGLAGHTEDSPGLSIVSLSVNAEIGGYSKRTKALVLVVALVVAAVVLVLLVVLIESLPLALTLALTLTLSLSLTCAILRIESLGLLIVLLLVLPVSSAKGLARLERGSAGLER